MLNSVLCSGTCRFVSLFLEDGQSWAGYIRTGRLCSDFMCDVIKLLPTPYRGPAPKS